MADSPSLLILLSAPSGAGKTTVCQRLLEENPLVCRAVTCTTRPPREGEKPGIDYHFWDQDQFVRGIAAGEFLEHATVYGHHYGTLQSELRDKLQAGRDILLAVDVQGAATIRQKAAQDPALKAALVSVFLTPPSLAVLEQRLRKRGTDSEATRQKRLAVARQEITEWRSFDYLIVSGTIEADLQHMRSILAAEKMRIGRVAPPVFT
jgi:guanylate kinase